MKLAQLAEGLAEEALAAEQELLHRYELQDHLGLPIALRRCLRRSAAVRISAAGPRLMRFDFHWTAQGWRISEGNTDVAAGYIEASGVTRLMARHYPHLQPAGDPAGALAEACVRSVGPKGRVGLMHLTIYSEDRQVMLYLAQRLKEFGLIPYLFGPEQLRWKAGQAHIECDWYRGPVDLLIRFLPAEWLPRLPAATRWQAFLSGGRTPVCNPGYAVLSQSKRFALTWDRLSTPLPTWGALLPATCSPREVNGQATSWVLKPALGHEGNNIGIHGVTDAEDWREIARAAARAPDVWAAQQRFDPLPLQTPEGLLYPCIGVYVIDGHAAGAYGRVSPRPLIDQCSREVVVLVRPSPSRNTSPHQGPTHAAGRNL